VTVVTPFGAPVVWSFETREVEEHLRTFARRSHRSNRRGIMLAAALICLWIVVAIVIASGVLGF